MSQHRDRVEYPAQAVAGSTALAPDAAGLSAPQHEPGGAGDRRTPLSVVPAGNRRRRVPFAIFCFLSLAAALVGVLVLNVSVSSGQYQLVELHSKQAAVTQKNEMLTQQVKNHVAPQNLASKAAELGMVSSPTLGTIDLNDMRIAGQPEPAEETDGPDARVPAPNVSLGGPGTATPRSAAAPAASATGQDAGSDNGNSAANAQASAGNGQAGEASSEGQGQSSAGASNGQAASNPASSNSGAGSNSGDNDGVVPAPAQREPVDLNGGTIPAPQQAGQQ